MKRTSIIICLLLGWVVASPSVRGQMELTGFSSADSRRPFEDPPEIAQRKSDVVHGYYPKFFSEEARAFSTTAEQQGHYIAGFWGSELRPLPQLPEVNLPPEEPAVPRVGVFMAQPRPMTEEDTRSHPVSTNDRPVVYNDSRGIEDRIRQHQWTTPEDRP